jgi:hypothetical protein
VLIGGQTVLRVRPLFITCAVLVAGLTAARGRSVPSALDSETRPHLVGQWVVTFANGVVETCQVRADGTASEREPNRSADGMARVKDNTVVITFGDDRVERWTVVDRRVVVEHWFPAAAYPAGARVQGVAARVPAHR